MNREKLKLCIDALRTTKISRTNYEFVNECGQCCSLGIFALTLKNFTTEELFRWQNANFYDEFHKYIRAELQIDHENKIENDLINLVVGWNDENLSFEEIADLLEKQYLGEPSE